MPSLTKQEIEAILPHRDPFLFLDEVVDLRPGEKVVARKQVRPDEWYLSGHFPGRPIMPGVLIVEAMAQAGAVAVLSEEENRGKLALFAGIDGVRFKRVVEPGDELELTCELERVRGPDRTGQGDGDGGRIAGRPRNADLRGRAMIGRSNGAPVSITGLGTYAPERVLTNDELAELVDTTDEWIIERTGIKERRIAAPEQAMTDLAPAARMALERAGVEPEEIDLIIVATVTPDMMFPTTARSSPISCRLPRLLRTTSSPGARASSMPSRRRMRWSRPASRRRRSSWAATCSRRFSTGPTARRSSSSVTEPAPWCSSGSTRAGSKGSSWAPTAAAASTSGSRAAARARSRTPTGW